MARIIIAMQPAKSDMAVDVENFGLAEVEHIGPTVFL